MAGIGLLVAIPVTILASDGDEDDAAPVAIAPPEAPELGDVKVDRQLGIEFRLPSGWERSKEKAALSLRSDDGSVLIAISAPGPSDDAKQIHRAALDAIESKYRAMEVVSRDRRARVAGRPAEVAAISARQPKDRSPLRILVATAKGEKRAYLIETFAAGEDPNAALVEAQLLLNELRLEA
jgi:hypothetical protein